MRTSVLPFVTTGTRIVVMTADGSCVERAKDQGGVLGDFARS